MDRTPRLAELVLHLTGCNPRIAMSAVHAATDHDPHSVDDALAIVARAMCSVRRVDLRAITEPVDLRVPREIVSQ